MFRFTYYFDMFLSYTIHVYHICEMMIMMWHVHALVAHCVTLVSLKFVPIASKSRLAWGTFASTQLDPSLKRLQIYKSFAHHLQELWIRHNDMIYLFTYHHIIERYLFTVISCTWTQPQHDAVCWAHGGQSSLPWQTAATTDSTQSTTRWGPGEQIDCK